jgi:uncharacterized protein YcnI
MRKLVAAAGLTAVLWTAGTGAAQAHVTVNPREATKGGFAAFDVRVPTERPDASTTEVTLGLPVDHPIGSVSVQPVPGWTYAVTRTQLAEPLVDEDGNTTTEVVSAVTWRATEGNAVRPGEFVQFPISLGPLPEDVDEVVFKATQTYDSGEVVRWIEEAGEDGAEPERPAPVVTLVAGDEDGTSAPAAASPATSADKKATTAIVVSLIAAALALAALTAGRGTSAPEG